MKIGELLHYLWDGVDIPVTKEEVQHSVNVLTWGLKESIKNDKDLQEANNQYKIAHYNKNQLV